MWPTRRTLRHELTSVWRTNDTSLIVFRAILRQPGYGSGLHQPDPRLWPTLCRPRLPAPRTVPYAMVRDGPEQRVDQYRPPLKRRCLDLWSKCRHHLLGSLEAHLAWLDA